MSALKSIIARRGGKRIAGWLAAAAAGYIASRSPELVAAFGGQEHLATQIAGVLGALRDVLWLVVTTLIGAALEARAPKDHPA